MRQITLLQPQRLAFGPGVAGQCVEDLRALGVRRAFVVTSPPVVPLVAPLAEALRGAGLSVTVYDRIVGEPTIASFEEALAAARPAAPDVLVGIGGGSALDVSKLLAVLLDGAQDVRDVFGIGLVRRRAARLVCLPTTAGTGSEVSPNAILLDEAAALKKGVVSPFLVPDAAYVDPLLTRTVPPGVTAATGLDALIHCLEAYANRFAHPLIDLYALEGIRLVGRHLERAVADGSDAEAREGMALASLYGGLCLGPVNTAAVHALSYPLGGEFHVAHGISNAVLLPAVMEFTLPAAPQRYAEIARALGAEEGTSPEATARAGVARVREVMRRCAVPQGMRALGVPEEAIPHMAVAAMQVTRLLRNNPRELTLADAEAIYRSAY
ncbi:MAG: iron-containing alcohol dehydrogenase [Chloroflexi bacterium]|nr:iron-containing alcohol dehydrogenase [Chloroflexota bacterium]